jgi:hypothetical protein
MFVADDPLAPLRAALGAPDQRVWHRRLRRWLRPPAAVGSEAESVLDAVARGRNAGEEPEPVVVVGRRRWLPLLAVPVLASAVVLVTALRGGAPPAPSPTEPAVEPLLAAPTTAPAEDGAVRLWPIEAVEVVGREVRRAGERWEVGAEGDVVVVGDWDCDRLPTPAVLRPSTGAVAVFDTWSATGAARTVTTIAGASTLRPGATCGEASIVTADGAVRPLDTRPQP